MFQTKLVIVFCAFVFLQHITSASEKLNQIKFTPLSKILNSGFILNSDNDPQETILPASPRIVQLDNQTKVEGKIATIECKADGIPRPILSIRKNGLLQPLKDGQDGRIELEEIDEGYYKSILRVRINNVERKDGGLYFCKATNALGAAENAGYLNIMHRPDMQLTPTTIVKSWSPNVAILTCIVQANPNATISWKFQNQVIESGDDRYRIHGTSSYSNLLVFTENHAQFEVFGLYTCEARNILGENSINIILEEATVPAQVTQIVVDNVTPTTITFRLLGPGNTGGIPITNYIMKYKISNKLNQTTTMIEWIKDGPYILKNLKPRTKYQFSVSARNMVGEGPAKTIEYIMPEESTTESPIIITEQEKLSSKT